ncbi:hypothetical protein C0993_002950, partial [Termitomyces sp. T159_Od127]
MLRRGIHNVYHASLLRIHHPNDDRRFPGRLYSQLIMESEPEHETEWAADKIVNHAGSKNDAIFEVLWRAGDKTWLPYDQVQDLNLIQPYLEALGVANRADLPLGTGTPPTDDPQINLGAIELLRYKSAPDSPPILTNRPLFTTTHLPLACIELSSVSAPRSNQSVSMSYRPKSHYLAHPLLAVRTDGLVQLNAVDPNIVIHPLQLAEYIKFDRAVCRRDASVDQYMPAGYPEFATAYNASKGNNP